MDCRITLSQTNPSLGNVHANLEDHRARIRAAVAAERDLILFPELSLTGYFLKDQTYDLGLELEAPELAEVAELSMKVSIGMGFVERTSEGRLYNSYGFFEGGELLHVHRKVHLVTYGMFDESRDFAAGDRYETVQSKHGRFGVLICEDMWHMPGPYLHFLSGADALLVPSCSPARGVSEPGPGLASARAWSQLLQTVATFTQSHVLYVNRVGWEDGVGFGGGTSAFDPFGECTHSLAEFEPGELELAISSAPLHRARVQTPLLRDERPRVLMSELARLGFGQPPGDEE